LRNGYQKVPKCAVVDVPTYNLKSRVAHHKSTAFFYSVAAIASIQGLLEENNSIIDFKVLKLSYKNTLTLEKFERFLTEQIMSSVRVVKQDWPTRSGTIIRNAISAAQDLLVNTTAAITTPTTTAIHHKAVHNDIKCVYYELNLRNVYEFQKSNNPIKFLLERINFMMSDVLKNILTSSLQEFTKTIEDLCSCEITVKDVRNIIVNIPENSIYKRKVLPPLFSIAFRIASEDKLLNRPELDENQLLIANWNKTKEAENGDKCPIPIVKPLMGKTFEYNNPLDDFRNVFLKSFHHILNEFSEISHIQKYVMEKIYFPNQRLIPSISIELPWVQETLKNMESNVNKATLPLKTYLGFFKKYETFVKKRFAKIFLRFK
jgi:hypothetical protein